MGNTLAAKIGVAFGAFYVTIGIIGFALTGFDGALTGVQGHELLGISINQFHNIVHVGIGAFLLIMSLQKKSDAAAEGAVMGVGLFYVTAFVIGVASGDNLTILGITGAGDPAHFFHLLSGGTLLVVGLLSSAASASKAKKRGLA